MSLDTITLLFFGDIVGKTGRQAVKAYLQKRRAQPDPAMPDVIIANVENVSHGFGLLEKHYHDLRDAGIDVMTGGNHSFDRKDLVEFIDRADALLRPANMHPGTPGTGMRVFEFKHRQTGEPFKLAVINVIGSAFMGNFPPPWPEAERCIHEARKATPLIFMDIHAETTAEKSVMAHLGLKWGLSALVGTHTHVQTADDRIFAGKLGFLTDAGFNGAYGSIIGMEPKTSIARMTTHLPVKLEVMETTVAQINAVSFTLNLKSGACTAIERVNELITL
ncbi:MAG: TIGR00282 family metallophosphoesterase [Vampirovibrionales bacterium]|nr:TIGR00282 family metallophosphoesterase [Vampirovibrionales bacterium]